MANLHEKFKRCVMAISYQERKKKALERYKAEITALRNVEYDELNMEYVNLKTELEHRKTALPIFVVAILVAVLMNLWKYFFGFIENIILYTYLSQDSNSADISSIVFICSAMICCAITVVIILLLILFLKRMRQVYRRLIIVEEIRKEKKQ